MHVCTDACIMLFMGICVQEVSFVPLIAAWLTSMEIRAEQTDMLRNEEVYDRTIYKNGDFIGA